MQYVFNDPRRYINTIEFKNVLPILDIERIRSFHEESIVGNFIKKEFRYSFDNAIWSEWDTLNQGKLISIHFADQSNFYLHFKYTRKHVIDGNIESIYLTYDSRTITPQPPDSSIIDADLFQGEGPEYYLNNENHFGPLVSLEVYNVPDGSAIGVYFDRVDTSLSTELYFKRIKAGSGTLVTETSAGIITIDASGGAGGIYESALNPSIAMPNPVGGIPAGTKVADLNGDTINSLWDALLFPTAYPTLTPPSATFTITPTTGLATLQEIGALINIAAVATFNRGSISPQYSASSPYRSGPPNNYDYSGTGLVDVSSALLSNSQTILGYTVIIANQPIWRSRISYNVGVQPYDSKGNIFNTPWPAGTTTFIDRTFEGVYPLFGTTVNIGTLTKQTLVSMLSGNNIQMNLVAESGGNKQKFEIPVAWTGAPTNRPLTGIKTYNTVSAQWEYEGGSAFLSLLKWTTSVVSETIQGNLINYTRYTYNGVDRSAIQIRLEF